MTAVLISLSEAEIYGTKGKARQRSEITFVIAIQDKSRDRILRFKLIKWSLFIQ